MRLCFSSADGARPKWWAEAGLAEASEKAPRCPREGGRAKEGGADVVISLHVPCRPLPNHLHLHGNSRAGARPSQHFPTGHHGRRPPPSIGRNAVEKASGC